MAVDKFAVYDLVAVGPPQNIFEAAERGNVGFITRCAERTLEFDINQRGRQYRA